MICSTKLNVFIFSGYFINSKAKLSHNRLPVKTNTMRQIAKKKNKMKNWQEYNKPEYFNVIQTLGRLMTKI